MTVKSVFKSWKSLLAALPFLAVVTTSASCGMAERPTIRVGIGMTVDELKAGSTYKFTDEGPTFQAMPGQKVPYPGGANFNDWVITEPYDLVLVYDGHELKKDNIGGANYLIAITTAPMSQKFVDHISITFQNRALTLDEALAESEQLTEWFVRAGFHTSLQQASAINSAAVPFSIEQREQYAPPYQKTVTSYQDVKAAFIDEQAQVVTVHVPDLVTDNVRMGLSIVNARRYRDYGKGGNDGSRAATEREYFLNLSLISWPTDRYWDGIEAN